MIARAALLVMFASCAPRTGAETAVASATISTASDTAALQAAIDSCAATSCSIMVLEPRTYVLSRAGAAYYDLHIPAAMTIRGAGGATVLRQEAGTGPAVRILDVEAPNVAIEDLVLDGDAAEQDPGDPPDEHRAGIFARASGLLVRNVVARDFTGDGIYLYSGASGARLEAVSSLNNRRNGVTLGGDMHGVTIAGGVFSGNGAQQIDSEPGGDAIVSDVTIAGNTISGGPDYGITVSGTSQYTPGHGWSVAGNVIAGGVFVVWATDVAIVGNTITSATRKPCVKVYRTAARITIARNTCSQTVVPPLPSEEPPAGMAVTGTGTGQAARDILIADNEIDVATPLAFGIRLHGAIDVTTAGNTIRGAGAPAIGAAGILVRAVNPDEPFAAVTLVGNTIRDWGWRGIDVRGNGDARLLELAAIGNDLGNDLVPAAMTTGISLDDGSGALQHADLARNVFGPTVLNQIAGSAP